ncbi:MAG: carbon-nitrogen hydrolase family protein [Dehalococcoidia bacterium]|nr:carbon-nitrogen hydrolase family protein [Dehalococcoidia bacterium]
MRTDKKQDNMKAALVVPRLTAAVDANLATVERMAADAVSSGADLILLPEAVLTGLINDDVPSHDIQLGQTIPGPATDRLGTFCSRHGVWLGFGMIERQGTKLYDSAVLLRSDGSIGLKYRRNQPQWHGKNADPKVYCQGTDLRMASTPFGTVAFLLCGDLFDDAIVTRFQSLDADWLLFPFARCFSDGTADQARWDTEELPVYAQRVRMAQTLALMVNYLTDGSLHDDNSFGGAFVVSSDGEVLASHPLGEEGMLIVEM